MTASFLLIMGAYAVGAVVLGVVVVACFWEDWRG